MVSLQASFLALYIILTLSQAIRLLEKRDNPAALQLGIEKKDLSTSATPLFTQFNNIFYAFNLSIGTPPQNLSVVFDTGSRVLVLNSAESAYCQGGSCTDNGAYDGSKSSSNTLLRDGMKATYELGGGNGSWFTDAINVDGTVLKSFEFGVYNQSNNPQNFWGFGFPELLIPGFNGADAPPNTTLRTLNNQGVIKSASVGVKLAEPAAIVIGGVDTSAYRGNLTTLPIAPAPDGTYDRLSINLTSITASTPNGNASSSGNSEFPVRVMIDTGNFDLKLPPEFAKSLWTAFNITKNITIASDFIGQQIYGVCPCNLANSSSSINFGFTGFDVDVPMSSLVYNLPTQILEAFHVPPPPPGTCIFAPNPNPNPGHENQIPMILGGAFLQNVYFVVDEDSHQIGLAKLNTNPGEPSIQEIAAGNSGLSSIANSTGSSATATSSGSATSNTGSASGASSGSNPTSSTSTSSTSRGKALPIVLVLASTIAAILILG